MKTKIYFLFFASSILLSCHKDPEILDPQAAPVISDHKPKPATSASLPYDAKVIGQNCGLPLIEITRNNDSLVASGILYYSYYQNNNYAVVNLPDSLSKGGTELNLDVRAPVAADGPFVCDASQFHHIQIAVVAVRRK